MRSTQLRALLAFSLVLLILSGCKSFETSIKPVINPEPPAGYVPPKYITGTKPVQEVDPAHLALKVYRIDSDHYPDSIRLFVSVSDSSGNLVTNLAPPYYKGSEDYRKIWNGLTEQLGDGGPTAKIENFTVREFSDQDGIPYEIALALDYSGSMRSNLKMLEDAAVGFIRLKRPQDRIAVVKFDQRPQLVVRATSSESELVAGFGKQGLKGYGGYTAVYSAAKLGGDQVADAPQDHPRALVIFTDGEDNASDITSSDLFQFNRQHDIPIFVIAMGAVNYEALSDIANYTAGRFYQTYTPEELRGAFEDIYRNLRNYYLISYKPARAVGKHIVSVSLSPPGGTRQIAGKGVYNTLITDVLDTAGKGFTLPDITFDYNKATLRPESNQTIQQIAELMRERPRLEIEIRGHTDSQGGVEYNQKLSEERAAAVKQAIIQLGISDRRLRSRGFGMSVPKASNDTEEGRQQNRRTEFVVLKK
jgi:VWFA-related protein